MSCASVPVPPPMDPTDAPPWTPPVNPATRFGFGPGEIEPGEFDVRYYGEDHENCNRPCGVIDVSSDGSSLGYGMKGATTPLDMTYEYDEGYTQYEKVTEGENTIRRIFYRGPDDDTVYMFSQVIDATAGLPVTNGTWATLTRRT